MISKFRAWHNKKKKMYPITTIWFGKKYIPEVVECEISHRECFLEENMKNIILMQSTGLKDKNGKEIFEGDITKIFGLIREVNFNGARFFVKPALTFDSVESEDVKVIGNIYENPELLKELK